MNRNLATMTDAAPTLWRWRALSRVAGARQEEDDGY